MFLPIILLGLGILYLALAFRIIFIVAYTLLPLVMGLRLFDIESFRSLRSLTDITDELTVGLLLVGVLKAGIFGLQARRKPAPTAPPVLTPGATRSPTVTRSTPTPRVLCRF